MPFVPFYGGFPVDLITHVGEPIIKKDGETVLELKHRVQTSMKTIIEENRGKQSVMEALLERLFSIKKRVKNDENIYELLTRNIVLNKVLNFEWINNCPKIFSQSLVNPVTIALFILILKWPNSSRNAKTYVKFISLQIK